MTPTTDPTARSRRGVLRGIAIAGGTLALGAGATGSAAALEGKPNFGAQLYGDDEIWGTKGAAALDAPTENNLQSFDRLVVVTNGVSGQLPVAEAAPGNPAYNGGRWFTHTATWVSGTPVLLTSYDDVMKYEAMGHLDVTAGSPGGPGAPPDYFECPMLPHKG
jgi:hypothetical protein